MTASDALCPTAGCSPCLLLCPSDLDTISPEHVAEPTRLLQWAAECVVHGHYPASRELKLAFQLVPLPVSQLGVAQ